MKAYFINAKDELIVEVDCKDYYHKKELINCSYIELYPYPVNGNDMWTDEEANLRESNYLFQLSLFYFEILFHQLLQVMC